MGMNEAVCGIKNGEPLPSDQTRPGVVPNHGLQSPPRDIVTGEDEVQGEAQPPDALGRDFDLLGLSIEVQPSKGALGRWAELLVDREPKGTQFLLQVSTRDFHTVGVMSANQIVVHVLGMSNVMRRQRMAWAPVTQFVLVHLSGLPT